MSNPYDPNHSLRQAEKFIAAKAEAAALHDQAMLLGYDVGVTTTSEVADRRVHVGPLGHEPRVSFMVRRVDQPWEDAQTFATVGEVKERLKHLATLPRYCLDLEDPQIEVVTDADGTASWITDKETGEKFGIRTADLENTSRLCVHAETPPTMGNWQNVDERGR
jgi:hypothetical protein